MAWYDQLNQSVRKPGQQSSSPLANPSSPAWAQKLNTTVIKPVQTTKPVQQNIQITPPISQTKNKNLFDNFFDEAKKVGQNFILGAKQVIPQIKTGAGIALSSLNNHEGFKSGKDIFGRPVKQSTIDADRRDQQKNLQVAQSLKDQGIKELKPIKEEREKLGKSGGISGIAEDLAYNVPSLLSSIAVAGAATLITKNPRLGLALGFTNSYSQNASDVYQEAKDYGVDEKKATQLGNAGGIIMGAIDVAPIGRLITKSPIANEAKKTLLKTVTHELMSVGTQAAFEGGTEGLQQFIGNVLAKTYNENKNLFDGVGDSALIGALLGGGSDIAVNSTIAIADKVKPKSALEQANKTIVDAFQTDPPARTPEQREIVSAFLTHEITPQQAISEVQSKGIQETPFGQDVLKAAAQAQIQGKNIAIKGAEDGESLFVDIVDKQQPVSLEEDTTLMEPQVESQAPEISVPSDQVDTKPQIEKPVIDKALANQLERLSGQSVNLAAFEGKFNTLKARLATSDNTTNQNLALQMESINPQEYFNKSQGKLTPYDTPEVIKARKEIASQQSTHTIDTPERKALRQKIEDELYGNGAKNKDRRIDIVMGLPAAGKSTVFVDPLAKEHGSLVIDADMVKERLPEFEGGKKANVVHQESSDIAEGGLMNRALEAGDNIVLPVVGKNLAKMQTLISGLKEEGYDVHLHLNDVPPEVAAQRAVERFKTKGRFVDPNYVLNEVGLKPRSNFDILKVDKGVTSYDKYSNDVPEGQAPKFLERSRGSENGQSSKDSSSSQGKEKSKEKPQPESLAEEAKKYKSAEEFIKSLGEPLLHGTTKDFKEFDLSKAGSRNPKDQGFAGKGIYLTNSKQVAEDFSIGKDMFETVGGNGKGRIIEAYVNIPESEILSVDSFGELSEKLGLPKAADRPVNVGLVEFTVEQAPQISKKAQELGYKAIKVDGGGIDKYGKQAYEMVVFDPNDIKTKQQLQDIYTQATQKDSPNSQQPNQNPVGQGKPKQAKLIRRMKDGLLQTDSKRYDFNELDGSYNTLNLEKDANAALDLVESDFAKANRIANGLEEAPEGQTVNAISIAVASTLESQGFISRAKDIWIKTALRAVRSGQEIVSLRGSLTDTSPENLVREILKTRLEKVSKQYKSAIKEFGLKDDASSVQKGSEYVKRAAKKVQEEVESQTINKRSLQDIIEELRCK